MRRLLCVPPSMMFLLRALLAVGRDVHSSWRLSHEGLSFGSSVIVRGWQAPVGHAWTGRLV